jgi:hypothetical protein
MFDITFVAIVGLAAGFISYLVVDSSAMPKWWYKFIDWWKEKSPWGSAKPFTCSLCMSFWVSVVLIAISKSSYLLNLVYFPIKTIPDALGGIFVVAFASAGLSLLLNRILDRLSTLIL